MVAAAHPMFPLILFPKLLRETRDPPCIVLILFQILCHSFLSLPWVKKSEGKTFFDARFKTNQLKVLQCAQTTETLGPMVPLVWVQGCYVSIGMPQHSGSRNHLLFRQLWLRCCIGSGKIMQLVEPVPHPDPILKWWPRWFLHLICMYTLWNTNIAPAPSHS